MSSRRGARGEGARDPAAVDRWMRRLSASLPLGEAGRFRDALALRWIEDPESIDRSYLTAEEEPLADLLRSSVRSPP